MKRYKKYDDTFVDNLSDCLASGEIKLSTKNIDDEYFYEYMNDKRLVRDVFGDMTMDDFLEKMTLFVNRRIIAMLKYKEITGEVDEYLSGEVEDDD